MSINNFYVYVYLDPRKPSQYAYGDYIFDYEPFYVGKGQNGRWLEHLKINKYNHYLNNKIKKIQREEGIDPIVIKYCENMLECQALRLETTMIPVIGRHNLGKGPLCNLTDGGEGPSGYKHTENQCKNKSLSRLNWLKEHPEYDMSGKNNPMYGVTSPLKGISPSAETLQKISKSKMGVLKSPETKALMKKNHADYSNGKHPNYGKRRPIDKKYCKYPIEVIDKVIQMRKCGMMWKEIINIVNIPYSTVQKWMRYDITLN